MTMMYDIFMGRSTGLWVARIVSVSTCQEGLGPKGHHNALACNKPVHKVHAWVRQKLLFDARGIIHPFRHAL